MGHLAVVFVQTDLEALEPRRQAAVCLTIADRHSLTIRYWVEGVSRTPQDALSVIEAGEASALIAAHMDALGGPLARDAIAARLDELGATLHVAKPRRSLDDLPPAATLAAKMHQQGMLPEQIAAVLDTDPTGVRALLRQAARHGLLAILGVMAWMQDRLARAALTTVLAAGLVVGESTWHYPPAPPAPPEQVEQQPSPLSPCCSPSLL